MIQVDQQLREARLRMTEAENAWRSDLASSQLRERYIAAQSDLLKVERLAAEAKGQPFAVEWQVDGMWSRTTQNAVVMAGSFAAVLTFDGTTGTVQVVFQHPDGVRFSCVSDEIITGHPLFGKGLSAYGLFKVVNSAWIAELRSCDVVHPQHNEAHWNAAEHYLLCFKDRLCEVVTSRKPTWHSFPIRGEALQAALALCELEAPTPNSPRSTPRG
jgi:hypothetical protein